MAQEAPAPLLAIIGSAIVEDGVSLIISGQKIRMQGIDAPEISQLCEDEAGKPWRCGAEAAWALDALIAGSVVTCQQDVRDPVDRYGRALAICEVGGFRIGGGL